MKLLETFEYLSGYKINISKAQILKCVYTPCQDIKKAYKFNWKMDSLKYFGVVVTQDLFLEGNNKN